MKLKLRKAESLGTVHTRVNLKAKKTGITLISLVVTIIILLILAGVTLSLIGGSEGILGRSTHAVDENEKAMAKEQVELAVSDYQTEFYEAKYVDRTNDGTKKEYILEKLQGETYTEKYKVVTSEEGKVKVYEKNGVSKNPIVTGNVQEDGSIKWDDEIEVGTPEPGEPEEKNEAIKIGAIQNISSDYVKSTVQIQVEYPGTITEISINGEKVEVAKGENGIYQIEKEFTENGEYKIIAKDENGKVQTKNVKVTELTEDMEIWNRADMELFRDKVKSGRTFEGRTVRVMDHIDLEGSSTNQWTPINNFKGTFDGKEHTISNLFIQANAERQGLFGTLVNATVKNLTIDSSTIQGTYYIGAIAGASAYITVENVHTTSSVTVTATTPNAYGCYVGGLLGNANATISSSSNAAIVTGGGDYIGGIAGVFDGNISECYNVGTIKSNGNFAAVGGIIGVNYPSATITNCYNKGNINGYQFVGGIAGRTHDGSGTYLTVSNCYNIGTITANKNVSEIVGNVLAGYGKITNCYVKSQNPTAEKLGNAFVDDTKNMNGGYPILKWQIEK